MSRQFAQGGACTCESVKVPVEDEIAVRPVDLMDVSLEREAGTAPSAAKI
jgi:hypothetical protein